MRGWLRSHDMRGRFRSHYMRGRFRSHYMRGRLRSHNMRGRLRSDDGSGRFRSYDGWLRRLSSKPLRLAHYYRGMGRLGYSESWSWRLYPDGRVWSGNKTVEVKSTA